MLVKPSVLFKLNDFYHRNKNTSGYLYSHDGCVVDAREGEKEDNACGSFKGQLVQLDDGSQLDQIVAEPAERAAIHDLSQDVSFDGRMGQLEDALKQLAGHLRKALTKSPEEQRLLMSRLPLNFDISDKIKDLETVEVLLQVKQAITLNSSIQDKTLQERVPTMKKVRQ